MERDIEKAIEDLVKKSVDIKTASNEALHYTQSALNLAHVLEVLKQTKLL